MTGIPASSPAVRSAERSAERSAVQPAGRSPQDRPERHSADQLAVDQLAEDRDGRSAQRGDGRPAGDGPQRSAERGQALVRPAAGEAQRIFRAVLDALARPGTVTQLPVTPGVPAALAPLLALADLDTPICLLDGDAAGDAAVSTATATATATSAPLAGLAEARLVVALRPVTVAELRSVRTGTAAAPEDAALVVLAVPALTGGPRVPLAGPGTGEGAAITATGLPEGWPGARGEAAVFPAGADLVLVDPDGRCAGLPRSTRTEI